jgi:hypothetical protein
MTRDFELERTRGRGAVGTGVHLLRRVQSLSEATRADAWITVLFVPLVPLGEWSLQPGDAPGSSLRVTHVAPPRVLKSVAWIAGGLLAAVLALLPAFAALTLFMGSKPVELGGLFSSASAVVGVLAWLDLTRERVAVAAAVRVLRSAPRPPEEEG